MMLRLMLVLVWLLLPLLPLLLLLLLLLPLRWCMVAGCTNPLPLPPLARQLLPWWLSSSPSSSPLLLPLC